MQFSALPIVSGGRCSRFSFISELVSYKNSGFKTIEDKEKQHPYHGIYINTHIWTTGKKVQVRNVLPESSIQPN